VLNLVMSISVLVMTEGVSSRDDCAHDNGIQRAAAVLQSQNCTKKCAAMVIWVSTQDVQLIPRYTDR
jgi:hypothetical protein